MWRETEMYHRDVHGLEEDRVIQYRSSRGSPEREMGKSFRNDRDVYRMPHYSNDYAEESDTYRKSRYRDRSPEYRVIDRSPVDYCSILDRDIREYRGGERSPREYRSVEIRKEERRRRRHRSRSFSRSRTRSWTKSLSRSRSRSKCISRSNTRSRSRSRGSSGYLKYRKSPREDRDRYRERDGKHKNKREDRMLHEDDRHKRRSPNNFDRERRRDSDYSDDKGSSRFSTKDTYAPVKAKDEWICHVWNEAVRPEIETVYQSDHGGSERRSWRAQSPNRTLIIRGLAYHVNEDDMRNEILKTGVTPKDIRMIKKKDTGSSRGFAFIEFNTKEEAAIVMEAKDGELKFGDGYKVPMQYSIQKEADKDTTVDWYCKCSALNFKRREHCYRCGSERKCGENSEWDEVSAHPTNTVVLKGLDILTTEEDVLKAIQSLSSLPIRSVRIGRSKLSNISKGVCYLEMNNVSDAMYLHNALLSEKLMIDKKVVFVLYAKGSPASHSAPAGNVSKPGDAAVAAAQWSHQKVDINNTTNQKENSKKQYSLSDVPKLAEYSAGLYAKSPEEKVAYIKHYTDYYSKMVSEGAVIPSLDTLEANPVETGYEVPSLSPSGDSSVMMACAEPPSGAGDQTYPIPDVSTYQYDKTSGYYYDPFTTLYYDANSQYYYNSKLSKFLYWDGLRKTYLLAPSSANSVDAHRNVSKVAASDCFPSVQTVPTVSASNIPLEVPPEKPPQEEVRKPKSEDKDKVKVAKRIAKDMEKWAKTLNQKKEVAKQNLVFAQATPVLKTQGAADIGFAVLGRKETANQQTAQMFLSPSSAGSAIFKSESLVAEYGHGSDSEEENTNEELQQDDKHVDWNKMACLLCKRQFPNKETLLKHQQLSDLHRQNLETWYRANGISIEDASRESNLYRDRAKERRLRYGEPEMPPQTNKWRDSYMKAKEASVNYEQPTKQKIGGDNLGNKLLQKMGWQEGMGLGKSNQGMTEIIQARARPLSVGLGNRTEGITPGPGETYKDCVKKMMRYRYEERDDTS